jgi:uncharacterized membrane protein
MSIRELITKKPTFLISYTAIMTVIVFIFTVVFSLSVPQTRGFFNIGETGVYIAALTGGPIVGAIAGGLGSMLSDYALGYGHFAQATLLIKGTEGLITGLIAYRLYKKNVSRYYGILFGVIYALLIYILGTSFYLGIAEVTIPIASDSTYTFNLSRIIWGITSIITFALIIGIVWKTPQYTMYVISTLLGGLCMILGYFLYEQFILGVAAIVEVPINTMQMTIGTILSISIVRVIEKVWR